jgi:hypothetical protein
MILLPPRPCEAGTEGICPHCLTGVRFVESGTKADAKPFDSSLFFPAQTRDGLTEALVLVHSQCPMIVGVSNRPWSWICARLPRLLVGDFGMVQVLGRLDAESIASKLMTKGMDIHLIGTNARSYGKSQIKSRRDAPKC